VKPFVAAKSRPSSRYVKMRRAGGGKQIVEFLAPLAEAELLFAAAIQAAVNSPTRSSRPPNRRK